MKLPDLPSLTGVKFGVSSVNMVSKFDVSSS